MPSHRIPEHFYNAQRFISPSRDRNGAREQIAADTAAFTKAGGRIQTLGNTPLRRKDLGDDPVTLMPPDRTK